MLVEFAIRPSNDERIRNVQTDWKRWKELHGATTVGGATLLIVHTDHKYNDLDHWIKTDRSGGGILFVTGEPAGELARLKEQLSGRGQPIQELPHRWHVLRTPVVGVNAASELRERFGRFVIRCAALNPGEAIPWEQLYSVAVSENVLAIYLWCLAQPTLTKNGVTAPVSLWKIGDEAWGDLCTLNSDRGLQIPARAELNNCMELKGEACELFAGWFKNVLLPGLA
jgi:hypothetical protein